MKNKVVLNQTDFTNLAELQIGQRIRYLRELLQNEFGNDFSGKSVANRINLFSQSTLTTFEKGKTKDIPSNALYAISKDFGADLYMFFDDYYNPAPAKITNFELIPIIYKRKLSNEPIHNDTGLKNNALEDESYENFQVNINSNPLSESEFIIKTSVSKIASNNDEQITFVYKSRVRYSEEHLFLLLSQIINYMNSMDASIQPELINSNQINSSIKLAKDFLQQGKTSLHGFPWFSYKEKLNFDNRSFEKAVAYTEKLIKHDGKEK